MENLGNGNSTRSHYNHKKSTLGDSRRVGLGKKSPKIQNLGDKRKRSSVKLEINNSNSNNNNNNNNTKNRRHRHSHQNHEDHLWGPLQDPPGAPLGLKHPKLHKKVDVKQFVGARLYKHKEIESSSGMTSLQRRALELTGMPLINFNLKPSQTTGTEEGAKGVVGELKQKQTVAGQPLLYHADPNASQPAGPGFEQYKKQQLATLHQQQLLMLQQQQHLQFLAAYELTSTPAGSPACPGTEDSINSDNSVNATGHKLQKLEATTSMPTLGSSYHAGHRQLTPEVSSPTSSPTINSLEIGQEDELRFLPVDLLSDDSAVSSTRSRTLSTSSASTSTSSGDSGADSILGKNKVFATKSLNLELNLDVEHLLKNSQEAAEHDHLVTGSSEAANGIGNKERLAKRAVRKTYSLMPSLGSPKSERATRPGGKTGFTLFPNSTGMELISSLRNQDQCLENQSMEAKGAIKKVNLERAIKSLSIDVDTSISRHF